MNRLRVGVIGILLLLIGLRFYFFYQTTSNYTNGQFVSFEATLLSEPQVSGQLQKFSASPDGKEKFFVTIPRFPEFHYGDTVRISGILNKRLLMNKKIILTMYFPKIEASKKKRNYALAVTSDIRQKIASLYQKTLPPHAASLLLGIVFGIKENMDKNFVDTLRVSGVLHVIAASGMNVTMTAGFLSSIFTLFFRRQVSLLLTIGGILFYATLAGLEPSIMRASVMGILVFSAQILGRQYAAVYGLMLAAYVMLFISPALLYDVGFQLSFTATLGLIILRPLFAKRGSLLGEDMITTICAQIATIPILVANFGTYSLWSILVNSLVLWVVPILMVLGAIGAAVGLIFQPIGQIMLYLALPCLLYFEKVTTMFAGFGGVLKLGALSWQYIAGYYFVLMAGVVFLTHEQKD